MAQLTEELTNKFNDETEYQHSEIKRGNDRLQDLENMVKQERDDRVESLNTQLDPINKGIDKAFTDLDAERNGRV